MLSGYQGVSVDMATKLSVELHGKGLLAQPLGPYRREEMNLGWFIVRPFHRGGPSLEDQRVVSLTNILHRSLSSFTIQHSHFFIVFCRLFNLMMLFVSMFVNRRYFCCLQAFEWFLVSLLDDSEGF